MDKGGEWIIGSSVPLEKPWRGRTKLVKMACMAIQECFEYFDEVPLGIPLFLCVAEQERPGRIEGLEDALFLEIEAELRYTFNLTDSLVFPYGRVSAAVALNHARSLIYDKGYPFVLIAGVDSLLVGSTLAALEGNFRLLTSQNSNGAIPGEAGSAILISHPSSKNASQLLCSGLGLAMEAVSVDTEAPFRADGLVAAIKQALADARCEMGDLDFRITDVSGESYYFKEAALALTRTLRKRKEHFYIWHPADCIGEVGAAIGPALLSVALTGSKKGYTHGDNMLCHFGNDKGQRAAAVLNYRSTGL